MQRFDWAALQRTSREDVDLLTAARALFPGTLRKASEQLAPPPGCTVRPQLVGYGADWSLPASESLSFQLTSEDLCVSVRFAAPLALAAVDGILGKAPDRAQPARVLTPIELGVFEYCLLDWLTQARTDVPSLAPPVLASLASPAEHLAEAGPVLRLHCAGDHVAGRIELRLKQVDVAGHTAQRVETTSPLISLPIDLAVRVASAHLDGETLKSVEPGDAIVFDRSLVTVIDGQLSGQAILAAPAGPDRFTLSLLDGGALRVEALDSLEEPMSEPTEKSVSDVIAEDVELTLNAELGRVRVTLAEVGGYGEGHVINLGKPVGTEVDLTLSGRLVGRGELMDIDGELGVRVTRWSV
ncbi:MAG: hypothetical protein CMH55_08650 [Myxococcales bacterium]|nr:hypothetical protein [Myxococcales bacterium]